jgi:Rps23 Pro-64 3,4-dihydroxylase Tpa1-like proline 4-hydroxylase
MNFFYSNKSLNNGGFSICSFFILNSTNSTFNKERNVFETSYIKERLEWELVNPKLLERLDKQFHKEQTPDSVLPSSFNSMKQKIQIRETVNFFEHLLFKDSLVDAFLDGQEFYPQIIQHFDPAFINLLKAFTEQNKKFINLDLGK